MRSERIARQIQLLQLLQIADGLHHLATLHHIVMTEMEGGGGASWAVQLLPSKKLPIPGLPLLCPVNLQACMGNQRYKRSRMAENVEQYRTVQAARNAPQLP